MAKTNSHEIWPGSMWLPEPGLSLEEQCQQELEMMAFINNIPPAASSSAKMMTALPFCGLTTDF